MDGGRGRGRVNRDEERRRVLDASDIVDVVGEHLTLTRKGREYACLCPFHDDTKPSMCVVPHKQMFHCFACGAGGDVFTFVQRYHGMSFREAKEHLAERAGIELEPWRPAGGGRDGGQGGAAGEAGGLDAEGGPHFDRRALIAANGRAAGFFRAVYRHETHGRAARELAERRGVSAEMIDRFGIGAAPARWDGLLQFAQQPDVCEVMPEGALLALGLVKRRDGEGGRGGVYDALRNRLVFPIRSEAGEVIAFGGRRIDDEDEPKYLNSPETFLFEKRKTLYGLDVAGRAIRDERTEIVVEGYTDVVACHQAGLSNVVGTLGTALTRDHARRLRGRCDRIVLLFDGDEAGQRAAERAFEALFSSGIDVHVAMLSGVTDAKDPDELLKRDGGRAVLKQAIDGAEHLIDFWGRRLRTRLDRLGPAARAREAGEEMARLSRLGLRDVKLLDRRMVLDRVAAAVGVPIDVVARAMPAARGGAEIRREPSGGPSPADPARDRVPDLLTLTAAERRRLTLLTLVLECPDQALLHEEEVLPLIAEGHFSSAPHRRLAGVVSQALEDGEEPTPGEVMARFGESDDVARSALTGLLRRLEVDLGVDEQHGRGDDAKAAATRTAAARAMLSDVLTTYRVMGELGGGVDPVATAAAVEIDDDDPLGLPLDSAGDTGERVGGGADEHGANLAERLRTLRRVHAGLPRNPLADPWSRLKPPR